MSSSSFRLLVFHLRHGRDTLISMASALSAFFAPVALAWSSSDRQSSSIASRRRVPVSNARAPQQPLLSLSSPEPPSTSGRLTSQTLRGGRRAPRRPLSRPPRAAEKPSSTSSSSEGSTPNAPGTILAQLPLFPLNLVAFPHADVPLHIFEARCVVRRGTEVQRARGRASRDRREVFSLFSSYHSSLTTSTSFSLALHHTQKIKQLSRPLLHAPFGRRRYRRGDGLGGQALGRHEVVRALVSSSSFSFSSFDKREEKTFLTLVEKKTIFLSRLYLAGPTARAASPAWARGSRSTSTRCCRTAGCLSSRAVSFLFFF